MGLIDPIGTIRVGKDWAYDPMAQSEDGPLKIIMRRKSKEEIKIVYDSSKYVRGGKSPRRCRSKVT